MRGVKQLTAHHRCLADLLFVRSNQAAGCSRGLATALPCATQNPQGATRGPAPGNLAVDASEVSKFSAMAAEWWDPQGPMAPLHSMNPTRVKFCRDAISRHRGGEASAVLPFEGLKIADIGSGGGLLSESLARLGGSVTGVDASQEAIGAAQVHMQADSSLRERLQYWEGTAEQLHAQGTGFDVVVASEVIEHVPDPERFCSSLAGLTVRGKGMAIVSTINRTPRSYAMTILGAERLLRLLPVGTHDWNKFITPDELVMMMGSGGMKLKEVQGMYFDPFSRKWSLTDDLAVNYIAAFTWL